MKNELSNANKNKILTTPAYWNSIPEAVKSMWQNTADQFAHAHTPALVCTHRPLLTDYSRAEIASAGRNVRRCSTGGRWGKSADVVRLPVSSLLASGYILTTYTPAAAILADKRDEIYSDDTH